MSDTTLAGPRGIDAVINPEGSMEVLSRREVNELLDTSGGGLYEQFRRCCLAVLNCGSDSDDTRAVLAAHPDFSVRLVQKERGVKIEIRNAPPAAFVDGRMIRGIREHLFAVVRDILYVRNEIERGGHFDLKSSGGLTDAVFSILRNAHILRSGTDSRLAVCWGGHSISREEYDYTKKVGYELGLRGLHVCTGCGPGAMKGPMKGATIGHAKQRLRHGRYIGISEPGIIAAESPNPIVNELVIMPDMEKRLEAFVRIGHGFVIFPGGVGTAEEILYLLGLLMHPDNTGMPFPVVLTGPTSSREYFAELLGFIEATLGAEACARLQLIIDAPDRVAAYLRERMDEVFTFRERNDDAYYFNWHIRVDFGLQQPFDATHENMARLDLHREQPAYRLAAALRRGFSGVVAGNVKEEGMRRIEAHGPFEIHGERSIMDPLDRLLRAFVEQRRMRLPGVAYTPCYRLVA
jgi:predicted Rossmann-fold nucleotide-binding protein